MIIYRIYNKINQKSYIGQSVRKFNERYSGSKWWIYTKNIILVNAVKKYGLSSFDYEILTEGDYSIEHLNDLERYYAEKYNAYRPNGYNIRGCGDNKFVDDNLKEELSKFRLGTEYKPTNKKISKYKGVSYKKGRSWIVRIDNSKIKKDKYCNSEIEAAQTYDKIALFLFGEDCFINFEELRSDYLSMNLSAFYDDFMSEKEKRKDNYFKDTTDLLDKIKPLLWEMSIPKIAEKLNTTSRKINYCLNKYGIDRPGKNYWQKNGKS